MATATSGGPSEAAATDAAAARAVTRTKLIRPEAGATVAAARKKHRDRAQRALLAASPRVSVPETRYEKLEVIGSGAYGVVYRALDHYTGETVAMKCLSTEKIDMDRLDFLFSCEVGAMAACRGFPTIVQLLDYSRDEAFIVMELVGPSLTGVMNDENGVTRRHPEHEVRHLVRQLLAGAVGMHRVGLMHRDIKPDNVLVDAHGNLKLCDLGNRHLACLLRRAAIHQPRGGTKVPRAGAPSRSVDYDSRIDAWAIGCIMAELLAGGMPSRGSSVKEQLGEVLSVLGTDDIREWSGCPDRLCLVDVARRASCVTCSLRRRCTRPLSLDGQHCRKQGLRS
ncbi:hypothetical protein PR202_gb00053 [Eleusine coracana subsp. coracana]|uniref:[RNA-polymerase]-subunit kinase n=1 Tax=Eleusine coracana subsp. coracana TaxID=191504 RepID=A0AAV5DRP4_ELECO|nr:hypothetical protein QOZ80_5BG0435650 [Eleusine coracana subsp. coracana]GJN13359.1 hypothetical protein PR202_gb00053 [Eleusine coracana subsp. coracana]